MPRASCLTSEQSAWLPLIGCGVCRSVDGEGGSGKALCDCHVMHIGCCLTARRVQCSRVCHEHELLCFALPCFRFDEAMAAHSCERDMLSMEMERLQTDLNLARKDAEAARSSARRGQSSEVEG